MRAVKDLVVFKEIWKEAYAAVNEGLVGLSDGYYAVYMISTPIETQEDTIYSLQRNPEIFNDVVEDCKMKSVKRFKNEIIEDFERRFYEDETKIPRFLNYENRIHTDIIACSFNKVEKKMYIITPVYIKYCEHTDHKQIEQLRKEGKISE